MLIISSGALSVHLGRRDSNGLILLDHPLAHVPVNRNDIIGASTAARDAITQCLSAVKGGSLRFWPKTLRVLVADNLCLSHTCLARNLELDAATLRFVAKAESQRLWGEDYKDQYISTFAVVGEDKRLALCGYPRPPIIALQRVASEAGFGSLAIDTVLQVARHEATEPIDGFLQLSDGPYRSIRCDDRGSHSLITVRTERGTSGSISPTLSHVEAAEGLTSLLNQQIGLGSPLWPAAGLPAPCVVSGERTPLTVTRLTRKGIVGAALSLLLLLCACLMLGATALQGDLLAIRPRASDVAAAYNEVQTAEAAESAAQSTRDDPARWSTFQLVDWVSAPQDIGIHIDELRMDARDEEAGTASVQVQGWAEDLSQLDRYVRYLGEHSALTAHSVTQLETSRDETSSKYLFSLQLEYALR